MSVIRPSKTMRGRIRPNVSTANMVRGHKLAENVLFRGRPDGKPGTADGKEDDKIACIEMREGTFGEPAKTFTWKELRSRVGRMSQALRARGVTKGDRVAVVASNSIDTLTVFLGVTALGGLFSSSSTQTRVSKAFSTASCKSGPSTSTRARTIHVGDIGWSPRGGGYGGKNAIPKLSLLYHRSRSSLALSGLAKLGYDTVGRG